MSRRNELLILLACTGAWLLMLSRMREALAFSVFDAPAVQSAPVPRAQVLHDAAWIGQHGAFRPLVSWTAPIQDSATYEPVIMVELPPVHLKGLIGGPPWLAVLSMSEAAGDDRVLRAGDSLGVVEVRAVRTDGVTVRFQDSTWTIALFEAVTP